MWGLDVTCLHLIRIIYILMQAEAKQHFWLVCLNPLSVAVRIKYNIVFEALIVPFVSWLTHSRPQASCRAPTASTTFPITRCFLPVTISFLASSMLTKLGNKNKLFWNEEFTTQKTNSNTSWSRISVVRRISCMKHTH